MYDADLWAKIRAKPCHDTGAKAGIIPPILTPKGRRPAMTMRATAAVLPK